VEVLKSVKNKKTGTQIKSDFRGASKTKPGTKINAIGSKSAFIRVYPRPKKLLPFWGQKELPLCVGDV